jgi:hypothetical protein
MLVCAAPEFVSWRPDFSSSGQASPHWTRLICEGEQLTNAINAVDWLDSDPAVQVELCEECGFAGCATGGYVHVSRLGEFVLWTEPHVNVHDAFESHQYRASDPIRRHGGLAIAVEEWVAWRQEFAGLPAANEFPQTVRRDLQGAWLGEAPIFGQFDSPDHLVALARERAVASDPSSLDDALPWLDALATWFTEAPEAVVDGSLGSASTEGVAVETIYFDVPDTFDRPVLREWRPIG